MNKDDHPAIYLFIVYYKNNSLNEKKSKVRQGRTRTFTTKQLIVPDNPQLYGLFRQDTNQGFLNYRVYQFRHLSQALNLLHITTQIQKLSRGFKAFVINVYNLICQNLRIYR